MPRPAQNPRHLSGNPPPTWSAAVAAIKEKGVLSGKRIERSERGEPGEFDWMERASEQLWNLLRPA
jgi:hypothetical protein